MLYSLDFTGIQNNWASDVINEISVELAPSNCSSGSEILFNWTWPGTETGCNCANSTYPQKLIFVGPCTKLQNTSQCQQIAPVDSIPFSYWKDEYIVCITRIQDYNFAAQHLTSSPNCPAGNVPCGQSLDYIFCVMNNTDCPITSMMVSDENPDPVLYLESVPFFGRYSLWYSRFVDKTPLVQGKISQNNPCFDDALTNTDEDEVDYILLNTQRTYCTEDMRWVPLSTITESDFYSANVNVSNFTSLLPNYTISEYVNEMLWSQYFRNVIPMRFNFICRSAIDKLMDSDDVYSTIIDTQFINLIVASIAFFGFGLAYPYFQITLLFKKNLSLHHIHDEVILQIRYDQKNALARTIKLLQFPFVLVAMIISFSDMTIFQEIYDNQCSDPITNAQFLDSANNIRNKTYYYNLSNLIFLCILIGLDAVIMFTLAIVEKFKKKHENDEENEEYFQVKNQAEEKPDKDAEVVKQEKEENNMENEKIPKTKEPLKVEMVSFEFPDEEIEERPTKQN